MILPSQFYSLLDCLTDQFSAKKSAVCAGREFGTQIVADAKDYFSVALIPESLPGDRAVLGLLLDDSARIGSRNGFTLTIYIDLSKIDGAAFPLFSSVIISHEVCHFAFYYELFVQLGGNAGSVVHSNFTHTVSGKMEKAITKDLDNTSQTVFDEHNIVELINSFGEYPNTHFARSNKTEINYFDFFNKFLSHLDFDKLFDALKKKTTQSLKSSGT